ncbi:HupE/UreJ protein [Paenibacillus cellulosilyticus]|uniref:HupE/UreJ protein n=1 Tax=Paenibacillus cellulosilyticus TaxID=375489 RepID=A0A2V2YU04_9BACL|nr:HupE/UreJ family protein [Paenibacillus cellulosilyticus]PWW02737.1 HupE/UreJ protein [Paenibacillus cellulosilyticus]QKS45664.1 HupE/UreJ family protein [Paenibacillus cellulosilyticus]
MRKLIGVFAVMLLLCLNLVQTASAHEMPSSAVSLDFEENRVTAELVLPIDRLEIAFGQTLTDSPSEVIATYGDELEAYIIEHVNPVSPDGEDWSVSVTDMSLQLDEQPYDLIVQLEMEPPSGAPLDQFTFNYDVIINQLITHKALISVTSDWNNGVTTSDPVLLGTLRADVTSIEVDRSGGSWWHGFTNLVQLGISHIAEGTDHLMFLLVLLLPAPILARGKRWTKFGGVRHSIAQLLKVATAFTVGHSLTLIAGALGWIPGSSQWVETLIAVSILVSAIHAIRPIFPGREALVAFGFGLIHGMAFASLIEEIGLSPWRMASSLLGFNVGIELMQLTVIAATMPWLLLLSVTRLYRFIRLAGAGIAIVASVAWIVERVTQASNPVASAVNASAPYAGWLIVAIAVIAITVALWRKLILVHKSKPA